jgi:hypothetical protein
MVHNEAFLWDEAGNAAGPSPSPFKFDSDLHVLLLSNSDISVANTFPESAHFTVARDVTRCLFPLHLTTKSLYGRSVPSRETNYDLGLCGSGFWTIFRMPPEMYRRRHYICFL